MKNKKIIFLNILLIFIILSISFYSYALDGILTEGSVNFRKTPNTNEDNIISSFKKGEKVSIISKDGSWYKVQNEAGRVGYVSADFIKEKLEEENISENKDKENKENINKNKKNEENKEKKEEQKINKIKLKNDLKIYSLPIYYSKNIKDIKKGDEIEKNDELGIWIKVKTNDGYIGWSLKSDLN